MWVEFECQAGLNNFISSILKVVKASSSLDVDNLNEDSTFINILSDIGSTSILSVSPVFLSCMIRFILRCQYLGIVFKISVFFYSFKTGMKLSSAYYAILF